MIVVRDTQETPTSRTSAMMLDASDWYGGTMNICSLGTTYFAVA
jgi:hypothetical protein